MFIALSRHARASFEQYYRLNSCRKAVLRPRLQYVAIPRSRYFSFSPILLKKRNKVIREAIEKGDFEEPVKAVTGGATNTEAFDDAFDFTNLERKILKAIEHMTHKLSELKAGGTMNHRVLETLDVQPDKHSPDKVKLQDIAQVVTKGRHMNIILYDEANIKPVKSAIQGSNLSLTPQGPTDDAPTTLTITIPPPTGESRMAALSAADKISQIALDVIRDARAQKHKKLRGMQVARQVRADDIQKASKEMEQIVKRGNDEVKMILESHRRVLNR